MIVVFLCSCDALIGYDNKKALLNDISNNIDELNNLVYLLKSEFPNATLIENGEKLSKKSIEYHNPTIDSLSEKICLRSIYVNLNENIIEFVPQVQIDYAERYPMFYYSVDGKEHYEYLYDKKYNNNGINLHTDKWHIYFSVYENKYHRHGWYIEKLDKNWYYAEEDYGYCRAIDYIKDDLIEMGKYYELVGFMKKPDTLKDN